MAEHDSAPVTAAAEGERGCGRGLRSAERFMEQLVALAAHHPLAAEDIRDAFAAFCTASLSHRSRRMRPFERALIDRIDARFDVEGEGRLSRRVVIGLTFALARLLTAESFRQYDLAARRVADTEDKATLRDNGDILRIVDGALVALARRFDGAFVDNLDSFVALVNGRLGAARPGRWDTRWELTRPMAVVLFDDLYGQLRAALDDGALDASHGDDAAAVLVRFFAELDDARQLASRPWLRRPLGATTRR